MEDFYILLRRILCKINHHYHPEEDGLYLAGVSTGRCHACDKIIRKDLDYMWKEMV